MFNAMSLASLTMMLSMTGTPCVNSSKACGQQTYTVASLPARGSIGFARAFVGGQDVVHIMRSDSRNTNYMDIKASDLLISYAYDKNGKLIDRKVWFEKDNACSAGSTRSIL
jgi:hypothetical protein